MSSKELIAAEIQKFTPQSIKRVAPNAFPTQFPLSYRALFRTPELLLEPQAEGQPNNMETLLTALKANTPLLWEFCAIILCSERHSGTLLQGALNSTVQSPNLCRSVITAFSVAQNKMSRSGKLPRLTLPKQPRSPFSAALETDQTYALYPLLELENTLAPLFRSPQDKNTFWYPFEAGKIHPFVLAYQKLAPHPEHHNLLTSLSGSINPLMATMLETPDGSPTIFELIAKHQILSLTPILQPHLLYPNSAGVTPLETLLSLPELSGFFLRTLFLHKLQETENYMGIAYIQQIIEHSPYPNLTSNTKACLGEITLILHAHGTAEVDSESSPSLADIQQALFKDVPETVFQRHVLHAKSMRNSLIKQAESQASQAMQQQAQSALSQTLSSVVKPAFERLSASITALGRARQPAPPHSIPLTKPARRKKEAQKKQATATSASAATSVTTATKNAFPEPPSSHNDAGLLLSFAQHGKRSLETDPATPSQPGPAKKPRH